MLQRVLGLQKVNAQWTEILQMLNPDDDPEVQRLLLELRGPHLFAPHVGLNVLETGYPRVLIHDPRAGRLAVLQAALQGSERFTRPV
jgi:hypothetical protein